jgi:hypothetical protein
MRPAWPEPTQHLHPDRERSRRLLDHRYPQVGVGRRCGLELVKFKLSHYQIVTKLAAGRDRC